MEENTIIKETPKNKNKTQRTNEELKQKEDKCNKMKNSLFINIPKLPDWKHKKWESYSKRKLIRKLRRVNKNIIGTSMYTFWCENCSLNRDKN